MSSSSSSPWTLAVTMRGPFFHSFLCSVCPIWYLLNHSHTQHFLSWTGISWCYARSAFAAMIATNKNGVIESERKQWTRSQNENYAFESVILIWKFGVDAFKWNCLGATGRLMSIQISQLQFGRAEQRALKNTTFTCWEYRQVDAYIASLHLPFLFISLHLCLPICVSLWLLLFSFHNWIERIRISWYKIILTATGSAVPLPYWIIYSNEKMSDFRHRLCKTFPLQNSFVGCGRE